MNLVVL